MDSDYASVLEGAVEPYRSALRRGDFSASMMDDEDQVIPADWIDRAMERWEIDGCHHVVVRGSSVSDQAVEVCRTETAGPSWICRFKTETMMAGLFGSTPRQEPTPRMPDREDPTSIEARRRKLAELRQRSGRASTVMTDSLTGSTGHLGA